MLDIAKSTVPCIFVGWAVFLENLFTQLNLQPSEGFLFKNMANRLVKTGHGMADVVIDKFQYDKYLDQNSLRNFTSQIQAFIQSCFSSFKNVSALTEKSTAADLAGARCQTGVLCSRESCRQSCLLAANFQVQI